MEYAHKGYKLVWSDGGISCDDMASQWLYDEYGNLLGHATVRGKPPTEEEAREQIDFLLYVLERCVEKMEETWLREVFNEKV